MQVSKRPQIVARVTSDERKFPYRPNYKPTRAIRLYFEQYNERKGRWQEYYQSHHIGISKAYIARKNKKKRNNGKLYSRNKGAGGYIPSLMLSSEEALVHVLAHELRHFWQCNHLGKRGKVFGARGRFSERDADAYPIKKTREWRHLHNNNIPQLGSWL